MSRPIKVGDKVRLTKKGQRFKSFFTCSSYVVGTKKGMLLVFQSGTTGMYLPIESAIGKLWELIPNKNNIIGGKLNG